jgi:hypothetical protein
MDEPWILLGTYPGFLTGVIFSVVLGIAARRRRLDELSVGKVARWGALAGLLIAALVFIAGDAAETPQRWLLPLVVVTSFTVLSSASAAASLALAKRSEQPRLTEGPAEFMETGVSDGEAQELRGGRR